MKKNCEERFCNCLGKCFDDRDQIAYNRDRKNMYAQYHKDVQKRVYDKLPKQAVDINQFPIGIVHSDKFSS